LPRARAAAAKAGVEATELSGRTEGEAGRIAIGIVHFAKGLEFRAVAVMACGTGLRHDASSRTPNEETPMAKDPMSNFEIPGDMRRLAEQSVVQAKAAFDGFITAAQKAVDTLEGQAAAAQASTKDVGRKAMSFAEQNVTTSFEFAQKLVRATDVQEVMRLQAEFIKSQIATMSQQAKELGESAAKAAAIGPSAPTPTGPVDQTMTDDKPRG
jgi:phasin